MVKKDFSFGFLLTSTSVSEKAIINSASKESSE